MSLWVKWDVNAHKDEKISALTDTQFRAFLVILAEVKTLRSGGKFRDRKHVKHVIGQRLGRAVDNLIGSGLLTESEDGVVTVSGYSRYQVDPSSSLRQARYRAQKEGGLTLPEQSRTEQSRTTPLYSPKEWDSTRTGQPTKAINILMKRKP